MAGTWSVIRCPACRNCHGTRGQPRQCPHCGQSLPATTPIVATAETSAQLRIEVALANTPEELRDELRTKLEAMDEPLIVRHPLRHVQYFLPSKRWLATT